MNNILSLIADPDEVSAKVTRNEKIIKEKLFLLEEEELALGGFSSTSIELSMMS